LKKSAQRFEFGKNKNQSEKIKFIKTLLARLVQQNLADVPDTLFTVQRESQFQIEQ